MGFLAMVGRLGLSLAVVLTALWAALALWYRFPGSANARTLASSVWVLVALAAVVLLWRREPARAVLGYGIAFAFVLFWWNTIPPSGDRVWADDVAREPGVHVEGNIVTIDNVRNFDWRSDVDYTQRWETRRYDLDRLRSADMSLSYWMGPAIAHTLMSFGFDDGRGGTDYVTFSIEIRKERGESFSAMAGFFKQFEISLVAADERDILRVRTNVRDEDVYLYRVHMAPAAMRSLFLAYADQAAAISQSPRFYNTLTANCTTIVFEMAKRIVGGLPMDYRLLASGYLPEYLQDAGALTKGYDIDTLRSAARITLRANAADTDPGFSQAIRLGVPGADSAASR